ncbi:MAG TPA: ATP-binding protein [Gemmatimonadales bacterium]|nr:ATP-binding protein [Gemmatimonadales bacterium]
MSTGALRIAGPRSRIVALAATATVALHSIVVLFGWAAGWSIFLTPSPRFIPMAPTTALAFFALSIALIARMTPLRQSTLRNTGTVLAWIVATMAIVNLVLPAVLDQLLGGAAGEFGRVRLGVMSPVTAAALIPLALAIAATGPRPHYAGALAMVAAVVGATVALGYAYGTPLLYGGGTIPVALPTGLSLLFLGVATVVTAGPDVWPLEPLLADTPRARMLRAFLPATAGLVVLIGLLDARFGGYFGGDRVLIASWFAVVGAALVTLIVSRLSRHIGNEIDRAYSEQHLAERRYRAMFEQSIAGVSTSRASDGAMLACNDALARIFGFDSAAEFMKLKGRDLWWNPADRDRMLAALRESAVLRNYECRMRRKDGKPIWILCNITLRANENGEQVLENFMVDVSDRKSLEQQLWQAQKLDALGSLAGGVAHDFNNLLTAIIGYADILRDDLGADSQHAEDLNEIIKASARATALTRQLLAFSRRQPFEPKALRLDERVADMEKMLTRLLGPAVRLVTASDPALAPIMADPNQIEQVVLNLAVNSRDAMPDGGALTIETRNVRLDEPYAVGASSVPAGKYVMLAVSDTGTGMSQETLGRLFEPFFTTKEKGKGTGLGLSTVYGIIKQSQGHVIVYSELGVGTTFKCYFPVCEISPRVSRPMQLPVEVRGSETILLVEDEESIRQLAASALERLGYRILAASDGDSAMTIAAAHDGPIHLLLSDGVLSGVRVPELLRRFVAQRPETKILLMSGYSQEAVFQNDIVAPNTAFLPKPFTVRQLTERVREVLDS